MNNPYDLHTWSKVYREEALQEARVRNLVERPKASREPRGLRRLVLSLRGALTPLRGVELSK